MFQTQDLDASQEGQDYENDQGNKENEVNKSSTRDDSGTDTENETSLDDTSLQNPTASTCESSNEQPVSKTSTNQPERSRKRRSTKTKIEETELQLLNTMSNAMASFQQRKQPVQEDDTDVFARNIANKLRKIKDPRARSMAEFEIESICYKANMGYFGQQLNPPF